MSTGVRSHAKLIEFGLVTTLTFGGIFVSTTAAYAADVPCGTPAQEAVFRTVHHAEVPAKYETVVVTPGRAAYDEVIHHDAVPAVMGTVHHEAEPAVYETVHHDAVPAVYRTVVTQEYQPAVYETMYQWRKWSQGQGTWMYHMYDAAGPNGQSEWELTEVTEQRLVSPEVPEQTEQVLVTPEVPAWDEQVLVKAEVPAWDEEVVLTEAVPAYDEVVHHDAVAEQTEQRLVEAAVPAHDEEVLVTPAVPAGPVCEEDETDTPVVDEPNTGEPGTDEPGTDDPGTDEPTVTTPDEPRQPTARPAVHVVKVAAPEAAPKAARKKEAAPAQDARPGVNRAAVVLPATGSEDNLGALGAGGMFLVLAGGMTLVARRRTARS